MRETSTRKDFLKYLDEVSAIVSNYLELSKIENKKEIDFQTLLEEMTFVLSQYQMEITNLDPKSAQREKPVTSICYDFDAHDIKTLH